MSKNRIMSFIYEEDGSFFKKKLYFIRLFEKILQEKLFLFLFLPKKLMFFFNFNSFLNKNYSLDLELPLISPLQRLDNRRVPRIIEVQQSPIL